MPATSADKRMKYLNLGCGGRFHPDWENVDFYATGPNVRIHDLRKRAPYDDETFDVVYHSHVLEHFSKEDGKRFLKECFRLLKSAGVIRVVVPDLEQIARLYIESLEKALEGVSGWGDNYEWMVMEMYDQNVREKSRGALVEYFNRNPIPNWEFVVERWGVFAEYLLAAMKADAKRERCVSPDTRIAWTYLFRNPLEVVRNKLLRVLLKPSEKEALDVGRFRRTGEVHLWMYDFYSLGLLLREVGFVDCRRVGATESRIPDWESFHLDAEPSGQTYKADSLYMEALKS